MKENEEVKEEQKRLEKKKFTDKKKATYFKVKWKEYEEKKIVKELLHVDRIECIFQWK